jgi:endonuclease/exonuclease/phosphatase family metal-dependent hydrolase
MRLLPSVALAALAAMLLTFDAATGGSVGTCAARTSGAAVLPLIWNAPDEHGESLDRWCRAVGPPIFLPAPSQRISEGPPSMREIVVVTWNAHLAEGRLDELIAALGAGQFTGGEPVRHFVLLVQELYRRGPDVPPPTPGMRSAFAIKARRPDAPDAADFARRLGLSFAYVPSMRNGADLREDRGNAVISTEPFVTAVALELPLERQRRVAIGVAIEVMSGSDTRRLAVIDAHLEPLSSPGTLWIFRNPRPRQMRAVLTLADSPVFGPMELAGMVVGGDLNTILGGADEKTYALGRRWSRGLRHEDLRPTHQMGRLDYLFFRSAAGWTLSTTRIDDKFGSDHHPVIGRFAH